MGTLKLDIERFDGTGDFGIWRKKKRAVLVQQKVSIAINESPQFAEGVSASKKQEILDTAFTSIILNLSDSVLRQVDDETTAHGLWRKLEELFLRRSLSNKIFLKKRLFGFKMDSSKTLENNLDEFKKVTVELSNIGEQINDENQAS